MRHLLHVHIVHLVLHIDWFCCKAKLCSHLFSMRPMKISCVISAEPTHWPIIMPHQFALTTLKFILIISPLALPCKEDRPRRRDKLYVVLCLSYASPTVLKPCGYGLP